jgi:hypothetical protein
MSRSGAYLDFNHPADPPGRDTKRIRQQLLPLRTVGALTVVFSATRILLIFGPEHTRSLQILPFESILSARASGLCTHQHHRLYGLSRGDHSGFAILSGSGSAGMMVD